MFVAAQSRSLRASLSGSIAHPFGLEDPPLLLLVLLLAFVCHSDLVRQTSHAKCALVGLRVIRLKLDIHSAALREVWSHSVLRAPKE